MINTLQLFLFAAAISAIVKALDSQCTCYTATRTLIAPKCAPISGGCFRPACVILKTSTIPGPNEDCPVTPTSTIIKPCPTKCEGGCNTFIETFKASSACLAPVSSIEIPTNITATPSSTSTTITAAPPGVPTSSSSCFTWVTGRAPLCPDVAETCITLDCIVLQTTTLPPANPSCPITPTVTHTPSCLPYCPGGCATQLVPIAAEPTPL